MYGGHISVIYFVILCVPAGKIPALEDMVSLRLKEHMVITVEPSQERTVSPSLLTLNEVQCLSVSLV